MRALKFLLLFFPLMASLGQEMRLVISVRHLQVKGRSYHHLFLYDQDGKMIRQLTDAKADDLNPFFNCDGDKITFERRTSKESTYYEYSLKDNTEKLLGNLRPEGIFGDYAVRYDYLFAGQDWGTPDPSMPKMRYMPAPDNSVDLIIPQEYEDDNYNEQTAYLRDRKTKELTPIKSIEGYVGFQGIPILNNSPFLIKPPLKALFFRVHRGSTDGGSYYALDLVKKRIVELSYNGSSIIPMPDRIGFFCISEERYQPLGDGRTVNCDYLDWWDENLKRTRFSTPLSRYGGASVSRPKKYPFHFSR